MLADGLGSNFEIERVGYKRYPICGMSHPAVDALRDLQREHGFAQEDVESLEAYGLKFVFDMVGRPYEPGDSPDVDAQFSLQYCLATVLLTGNISLADLAPEHTLGDERRDLASRISVDLDESLKGKWTARLELKLRDGRVLTRSRDKAAGQSDRPLSTDERAGREIPRFQRHGRSGDGCRRGTASVRPVAGAAAIAGYGTALRRAGAEKRDPARRVKRDGAPSKKAHRNR